MTTRYNVRIDTDEDGFRLIVGSDIDAERYTFLLADPEALYDHVKGQIGPWIREAEEAKQAVALGLSLSAFLCSPEDVDESGGYEADDPKHPRFHEMAAWSADLARKVEKGE